MAVPWEDEVRRLATIDATLDEATNQPVDDDFSGRIESWRDAGPGLWEGVADESDARAEVARFLRDHFALDDETEMA